MASSPMQIEISALEKLEPRPVRMWARALAGVIVILGIPATGLAIYSPFAGGVWPRVHWAIQVAAAIWLLPLFIFVAIKGRAPRTWPGVGSAISRVASSSRFAALFAAIRSRL